MFVVIFVFLNNGFEESFGSRLGSIEVVGMGFGFLVSLSVRIIVDYMNGNFSSRNVVGIIGRIFNICIFITCKLLI